MLEKYFVIKTFGYTMGLVLMNNGIVSDS